MFNNQLDSMCPQTFDELSVAKSFLNEELKKRNLTGIPSVDKIWQKWYTDEQINVKPPQMSLCDFLYEQNKNRMNLCAINYRGKKISYEELFTRIEDTAKRFQKMGVKEGDYINLAMPISPETVYMVYGLDKIAACASLIDPRVNQERMEYYLNLVNSTMVGITGLYAHTMRKAIKKQKNTTMINISPLQSFYKSEEVLLRIKYNAKLLSESVHEFVFNQINRKNNNRIITSKNFFSEKIKNYELNIPLYRTNRTAVVEYTSGTTGVPKGLELNASSMNLVVKQFNELVGLIPGQSLLGIMPPFISYGLVCGMHAALCSGLETIQIPTFTPERFAELVLQHKPNIIVCVPSFLELFMKSSLVSNDTDLSFIQNIIVGGNKMSVKSESAFNQWLQEHNCNILINKGGGMAEYASCLFYTPFDWTKKPGVYGLPMPAVNPKIVDENGKELGYYEVGEVHISSSQEMNGYVNNPKATNEFFYYDENGSKYGKTGDLGYIDINGMVTLLSRKKQMIIRPDGHNVFPSEISEIIERHSAVKRCLVTGIKDSNLESGEWPTAFIELKSEHLKEREKVIREITKLCSEKLPLRDRPRDTDYILVKHVVVTDEGKTDRNSTINKDNILRS